MSSPNLTPKKIPVGAIAGGLTGAAVLLVLLLALFIVCRRRRRSRNPILVPLAHDYGYSEANTTGLFRETITEKAARRQQYQLHTAASEMRSNHSPSTSDLSESRPSIVSEEIGTGVPLRQMVFTMDERIMVLESRRRGAEAQGDWDYREELDQPPPPVYSYDGRNPNYRSLPPTPVLTTPLRQSESYDVGPDATTPEHS